MVRAWMLMQSWLRSEGLDDSKEAWLCVIARLADSEDFKLLIQKWAGTKVSVFGHETSQTDIFVMESAFRVG